MYLSALSLIVGENLVTAFESCAWVIGIALALLGVAVLYVRLLLWAGALQSKPVRNLLGACAYLLVSICVVGAIVVLVRLDLFGLSEVSELLSVILRAAIIIAALTPSLGYVLLRRREELAGAGWR
jgi:hypothetical protein